MKKENVPSINMKHKVLLEMWKKFATGTFVVKTQHYVSMDASFIELMQEKNANGHIQDHALHIYLTTKLITQQMLSL